MIINFQGETSLTSSLPLTSQSDVLPNTPTINRCSNTTFSSLMSHMGSLLIPFLLGSIKMFIQNVLSNCKWHFSLGSINMTVGGLTNSCASNTFIQNEFDQIPILNLQHQHDGRRVDEPDEPASKPGQHPLPTQHQPQHTGEQESVQTNNMR